ncbi:hypothetical protein NL676_033250 [Syzygium grande]|nr:hypothetical protein NL676_033250 [Syzygium grande]
MNCRHERRTICISQHNSQTTDHKTLGLHELLQSKTNPTAKSNVITGPVDTGVRPESQSSSGGGLGPPPKKREGALLPRSK